MKNHVVCLYEESGFSAHDWAVAGYTVYCYDILHKKYHIEKVGKGEKHFIPWNALHDNQNLQLLERHAGKTAIVLGFPPCTDLAASGAKHFASKVQRNSSFQEEALYMVKLVEVIANQLEALYIIENPKGKLSSMWRKPDYTVNPCNYGGYLPEDDIHPLYPKYIAPRDAYLKETHYWTGNGFKMPPMKMVTPEILTSITKSGKVLKLNRQTKLLGGKSEKTKRIRSASPRGIARAIFLANKGDNE